MVGGVVRVMRVGLRGQRCCPTLGVHMTATFAMATENGTSELRGSVAIVNADKLVRILERMLDPAQFLSPHGIRGPSKYHLDHNDVDLPGSGG